uniref:LEM domain-containing protein n=1 Tax=Romanomermis culicivorax TaxID=13658 RepID=A0A915HYL2_ROMCU
MDVDVGSLSNEQLKSMLNKFGVSPGPIVGATRRVYENKTFLTELSHWLLKMIKWLPAALE